MRAPFRIHLLLSSSPAWLFVPIVCPGPVVPEKGEQDIKISIQHETTALFVRSGHCAARLHGPPWGRENDDQIPLEASMGGTRPIAK